MFLRNPKFNKNGFLYIREKKRNKNIINIIMIIIIIVFKINKFKKREIDLYSIIIII